MKKPEYVGDEGKILSDRLDRFISEVEQNPNLKAKITAAELDVVILGPHHLNHGDNEGYKIMEAICQELARRGIFATTVKPISDSIPGKAESRVGDAVIETADLLVLVHLDTRAPSQAYGDEVGSIRRNDEYCGKCAMLVPAHTYEQVMTDGNYSKILRKFPVSGTGTAFVASAIDVIESQVKGLTEIALNPKKGNESR